MNPLERITLRTLDLSDQPETTHILVPPGDRGLVAIDEWNTEGGCFTGIVNEDGRPRVVIVFNLPVDYFIYSRPTVRPITVGEAYKEAVEIAMGMSELEQRVLLERGSKPTNNPVFGTKVEDLDRMWGIDKPDDPAAGPV